MAVTQDEFESLVEAALRVDPQGLSGKHKDHGREAAEISALLSAKGWADARINEWWQLPNARLDGWTPTALWLSDETPTPETIRRLREAAEAE